MLGAKYGRLHYSPSSSDARSRQRAWGLRFLYKFRFLDDEQSVGSDAGS
jgi:hypothetical protein